MRRLKIVSITLLLGLFMMNCASVKNASEIDKLSSAIKGEWKIEYTECCGRTSATNYGGNASIRFNVKKSTYTIYEGEVVISKGSYTLEKGEIGTMIKMDERFPAIIYIEEGKLYVDRGYMDLERKVYTR